MKKLRLAYFGTPDFSAEFLKKILRDQRMPVEVALVVTQKDKPKGRSQNLTPSPVKVVAEGSGIPVIHIATPEELIKRRIDLALVFAYGRILKSDLLRAPEFGFWNVHPSLLPQFRGATPTVYPLILGEDKTGVSLMLMDEKMDHGPIIAHRPYSTSATQTNPQLLKELALISYELFVTYIKELAEKGIDYTTLPAQEHTIATFTSMLHKDDGFIEFSFFQKALRQEHIAPVEMPLIIQQYLEKNGVTDYSLTYAPRILFNMFRGLYPWPGVWTKIPSRRRLKILNMALDKQEPFIKTVQLEGKNPVSFEQFRRAYPVV